MIADPPGFMRTDKAVEVVSQLQRRIRELEQELAKLKQRRARRRKKARP